MGGRAREPNEQNVWSNLVYLPCNVANNFVPEPTEKVDIIYLCPNNPTGTTLTKEQLAVWVKYAKENNAVILFDAAYEAFITEEKRSSQYLRNRRSSGSCYRIPKFPLKTAGFTGTRCGYTVVPKALTAFSETGEKIMLNKLWNRRHSTKFNGTSYVVQRAAEALTAPKEKNR